MNKKLIRRTLALAAAAALCLAWAAPAFAAQTQWEYLQQIQLGPLQTTDGRDLTTTLGGPDAAGGTLLLQRGESCDVTMEASFTVPETDMTYASWAILGRTDLLYAGGVKGGREGQQAAAFEEFLVLQQDGTSVTVAKPVPGSVSTLQASFTGLELDQDAWIEAGEDPSEIRPDLTGSAQVELRCTIQAMATLPLPQVEHTDGEWQFESQKQADEYIRQVRQALDDGAAQLARPEEAVLRLTYRGGIPVYTANAWKDGVRLDCRISWPGAGSGGSMTAAWELGGETYTVKGLENTPLRLAVSLVPLGSGAVSTGTPVRQGGETAKRAAAVTAGAAALGLGGGAVLNGLSSALDDLPAPKRREDGADPDLPEEVPDLEGEDTPSVSMSFYRPFDDLVNTRGAAVDIRLTVSGGEGLRWHYIPTALCPQGLKAVVPAVAGASHEATLVLNLTGARMKKPHLPVFVTVVAWAFDQGGRLLKTTGTLELQLHRPGLEAQRTAEGGLKVTLYTDGNLDGIAEKVALKPEQYTCTREAGGALVIRAKKPYKGSCRLEAEG